ncbi:MAG: histidine phosphatase family protein [Anaerolineae bacterium]|nr:histidine phosphatase family protein [Anaerolineae bacterium]
MTQTTRINFVRHGEVYNPDKIIYGRMPNFRLSERGREQAKAAGEALASRPLAALFSSPQPRAQETAGFIQAHHPELKIILDERIDEIHSPHEGRPTSLFDTPDFDLYQGVEAPYELPTDLVRRIQDFIAQMRQDYAGQEIAAVTHGDILVFTYLFARGVPIVSGEKYRLLDHGLAERYPATASIVTLVYDDDTEALPECTYLRPYPDDLLDTGLSPR